MVENPFQKALRHTDLFINFPIFPVPEQMFAPDIKKFIYLHKSIMIIIV
jgi:hypothetical protein